MTFIVKMRVGATVTAVYTCPAHGEFDAEVARDESGGAPEVIPCPVVTQERERWDEGRHEDEGRRCEQPATWTPSVVACRVRRIEAVKGKWEKPERKTYLDTRDLADGMDIDDFREKRAQIWEEKRQAEVMEIKKGFG